MSEKSSPEDEGNTDTDIQTLAVKYKQALDNEPDLERLDEIKAEISDLEAKRSDVKEDFGEGHYLVDEINKKIETLHDERNGIKESTEAVEDRREALLQAASDNPGFRPKGDWLEPEVIQAFTHVLYGEQDDSLVVADRELSEPTDAENMGHSKRIQIMHEVASLAQDRLSDNQRVAEVWEEFRESRAHPALQVIASQPGVGPSEIADAHDKSKSTVRNWTSDLAGQDQFRLVHTPKQGSYHLSTIGKYFTSHYAEPVDEKLTEDETSDKEESKTEEEEIEESEPNQAGLGNGSERRDDTHDPEAEAEIRCDATSAETTDEKKDQLFDEVSASRD